MGIEWGYSGRYGQRLKKFINYAQERKADFLDNYMVKLIT